MKLKLAAFLSGLLFAAGLILSGMTQPARVIGFLDFAGRWDPSLAIVMAGAVAVHAVAYRWIARRERPLLVPRFQLPAARRIDAPLVIGAAIFGVGWALAGYCPGPGLTSAAALGAPALLFVATMIAGQILYGWLASFAAGLARRPVDEDSAPSPP